ncbi:MAG TPA: hypothetical protein DCS67_00415 [Clostridiales bacterium UBA8960]|nr:hypothetical protein [Clostridiales bacterium UBA8960]
MPYRGTNSKRNVVHDKSRGTIRSSSREHFLNEKKEMEHELAHAKEQIFKFNNDGYFYDSQEEMEKFIRVTFKNELNEEKVLKFAFPANINALKDILMKPTSQ